jgi:hypothetical protein
MHTGPLFIIAKRWKQLKYSSRDEYNKVWCHTPVILATQKAAAGRSQIKASLGKLVRPFLKAKYVA